MKKMSLLCILLIALASSPLFAEISMYGSFDYGWSSDFDTPDSTSPNGFASVIDTAELGFIGTVDEYSSVNFNFDFTSGPNSTVYVPVPAVELTTNITGVFGMNTAFTVTLYGGFTDFSSEDYDSATRYGLDGIADRGMETNLFIGTKIGFQEHFTFSFGINPEFQVYDDDSDSTTSKVNRTGYVPQMFVGINGVYSMFTAELYYMMNNEDDNGDYRDSFGGGTLASLPMDEHMLNFSASFNVDFYDITDYTDFTFGIGACYVANSFDVGVSFFGSELESDDDDYKIGFDAGYIFSEVFTLYGGVTFDLMGDTLYFTNQAAEDDNATPNSGMELGLEMTLGSSVYTVGYTLGSGQIENLGNEGMFMRIAMEY